MVNDFDLLQKHHWQKKQKRRHPTHPVITSFVVPKIKFLSKHIHLSGLGFKILDVGCGNGYFTYYFSKLAFTVGLDYSKEMLAINPVKNTICGTALMLPFRNNFFDLVFCANLLHHLENPLLAIEEMVRVSKKYVVCLEPNTLNPFMFLFNLVKAEEKKGIRFSLNTLTNLMKSTGVKVIASSSMGMIFPNKTPLLLLPFLKAIDTNNPFGICSLCIGEV